MAPDTFPRPKRVSAPSARVIDPQNIGEKQLSSHRAAQAQAVLRAKEEAALRAQEALSHAQLEEANQSSDSHGRLSPHTETGDLSHEGANAELEGDSDRANEREFKFILTVHFLISQYPVCPHPHQFLHLTASARPL